MKLRFQIQAILPSLAELAICITTGDLASRNRRAPRLSTLLGLLDPPHLQPSGVLDPPAGLLAHVRQRMLSSPSGDPGIVIDLPLRRPTREPVSYHPRTPDCRERSDQSQRHPG